GNDDLIGQIERINGIANRLDQRAQVVLFVVAGNDQAQDARATACHKTQQWHRTPDPPPPDPFHRGWAERESLLRFARCVASGGCTEKDRSLPAAGDWVWDNECRSRCCAS